MVERRSKPQSLENVLTENYRFRLKDYLYRGWQLFQKNWLLLMAYFATITIVIAVLVILAFFQLNRFSLALSLTLSFVLLPPLYSGFFSGIFTLIQTERLKFRDFFQSFSRFSQLVMANLLAGILIFIGCFISLILIPGIYLMVGYLFMTPLMLDKRLKFWRAMETSRLIANKQWLPIFAFMLLLGLINLGGALIFGLGLFVTIPLSFCAIAAAYDDIIGVGNKS